MRKVYSKSTGLPSGASLVETIIVAHSLNLRMLAEKFSIREEGFLDLENERELVLSPPKIFKCDSEQIRRIAGAKKGEKVFVVRQEHQENYI